MKKLSSDDKEILIRKIKNNELLDNEWLEKLFDLSNQGEFIWPGKYSLEKTLDIQANLNFSSWENLVFNGDNLLALKTLNKAPFKDKIDKLGGVKLIYIDPPFAVGADFHAQVKKGDETKEILAYSDRWDSMSEYYNMLNPRLKAMHELLATDGLIALHCDWRAAPGLRFILDEIFGSDAFVNEIIWHYTGGGRAKKYFSRKHDCIMVYAKGKDWTFNIDAMRTPYKKTSGYAKSGIVSRSGKHYKPHPKGTPFDDVWRIPMVNPMAHERVSYATQKPLALLNRIIKAFSHEGEIIADFFYGSGTSLLSALQLGRRFIGCDLSPLAFKVTLERLTKEGMKEKRHNLAEKLKLSLLNTP